MLLSTTGSLQGFEITDYLGIVTGETIRGANIIRDLLASVTDVIGGRSNAYEEEVANARQNALDELTDRARLLGADAILGVSLDFETIGSRGAMVMVTATGTAVKIRKI